jgi:poly-gamma-glutamate synthesis protein (capsule biosynthesis protein)
MADAGAVIVNGSQAHRPKEMEFLDGALIHYGLGNLFFDQMSVTINGVTYTQTRNEFIQRHVIYDGRYISTQLLTAVLEDWAKPRPMTPDERQVFLSEIFSVRP